MSAGADPATKNGVPPGPPASAIFHRALLYLIGAGGALGAGYQAGQWVLALLIAVPLLAAGAMSLRSGCVRLQEERSSR